VAVGADLEYFKAVKNAFGGTVNDVLAWPARCAPS
jgi:hypothetical protein